MPRQPSQPSEPTAPELIAADCLAARARLLSRTITGIYDEALRPLGVTVGQLNILVTVAKLGPVAPGDVARKLNMEKSTVSRNLMRMRDNGWLIVTQSPSGRGQVLELSTKGRRLLERSVPSWKDAQKNARALLGQKGAQALHRVADTVWGRLGQR